jgi:hypothetical protein
MNNRGTKQADTFFEALVGKEFHNVDFTTKKGIKQLEIYYELRNVCEKLRAIEIIHENWNGLDHQYCMEQINNLLNGWRYE